MKFGTKKPKRGIEDNRILTKWRKLFLQSFAGSDLTDVYRLSGGTALAAFYLEHRLSEDLDFFSSEKIPFRIADSFLTGLDFIDHVHFTKKFDRNIFSCELRNGDLLKTEFIYYPLQNLHDPIVVDGAPIDAFIDVVVNKLCALADRIDIKDYVDVYCAVRDDPPSLERFIDLAEEKCEVSGIRHILMSRLLKIPDGFERLEMMVHIQLDEMKTFFSTAVKKFVNDSLNK